MKMCMVLKPPGRADRHRVRASPRPPVSVPPSAAAERPRPRRRAVAGLCPLPDAGQAARAAAAAAHAPHAGARHCRLLSGPPPPRSLLRIGRPAAAAGAAGVPRARPPLPFSSCGASASPLSGWRHGRGGGPQRRAAAPHLFHLHRRGRGPHLLRALAPPAAGGAPRCQGDAARVQHARRHVAQVDD
jgi:hypothetical protein